MPNLAMRLPATQFSADGLDLAWPLGGEREVVAVPDEKLTLRIRRRIAEGNIVITDDAPTKEIDNQAREYRLLTGEEARKHMAEPAGPVTRVVYHPATPEDEQDYQLEVNEARTDSELFVQAQKAAADAAEKTHAEATKRQVKAEKEAAKADSSDEDDDADDPLAASKARTQEANDARSAEQDAAFMEREKVRQEAEKAELKHFDAQAKAHSGLDVKVGGETVKVEAGDTSADDKAFMEREKARQQVEADVEKQRQDEAKAAAKAAAETAPAPIAGTTSPHVEMSTSGRKTATGLIPNDTRDIAKPAAKPATKAASEPKKS